MVIETVAEALPLRVVAAAAGVVVAVKACDGSKD